MSAAVVVKALLSMAYNQSMWLYTL